jgi:aspartyl-tRNA(Asn)/glutamyl-tRNA(Gln) amidotransferase subunit A
MSVEKRTITELSRMIRAKEISAAEVTKGYLARIAEVEGGIGAYITVLADDALKQAGDIDARIAKGESVGALAGVPVALKDNICTQGIRTTCASKMLDNFIPPYNAAVAEKILAADMVLLGKLNMDEFAMGSSCEKSYYKITKNPLDTRFVAGGSSGGCAAAVAAGEIPVAIGTDTGGSIRVPSAYCGVVGLKPTYGAVSRYGVTALAPSLDTVGPIGGTVGDAAAMFDLIRGHDPRDAASDVRQYDKIELSGGVKGMTIGIPKEFYGAGVEPQTAAMVMDAAKQLEKQGAALKDISLPSLSHALPAYYIISSAEAASSLARFDGVRFGHRAAEYQSLDELYENSRGEGFGDEVKLRIMLGTYVLSAGNYERYYKNARLMQRKIAAGFDEVLKDCDVLLTPTAPGPAFPIGSVMDSAVMCAADICTVTVNMAGLPAISLPCGSIDGLPVGMQLIGAKFTEDVLLRAGYAYERIGGAR